MKISEELLAAYLEGRTNKEDTLKVLNALANDPELRKIVQIAISVDKDLEDQPEFELEDAPVYKTIGLHRELPMMQMAAKDDENLCSVICEAYILQRRNIGFDSKDLVATARKNLWLKAEGTPLHAIGQLLAQKGLLITRKYNATLENLQQCLDLDNDLIVAVDLQKLSSEKPVADEVANHAVVVTAIDTKAKTITLFDPEQRAEITVSTTRFQNAWNDSQNYMVRVLKSISEYDPEPINLDDVNLSDDLIELREAIAENLHDVWAITRVKEGWTYGPVRDDIKKQHPDIVPYCALPDSEKEYDRLMAWNTLKLVKKLGFVVKKS